MVPAAAAVPQELHKPAPARRLRRVAASVGARRIGAVAFVTGLVSVRPLLSSLQQADFFTPIEIAWAWLEYLAELTVIACALLIVYAVAEAVIRPRTGLRLAVLCFVMLCGSAVCSVLLYAYYGRGFDHLPPVLRWVSDSLLFGLPAVFLALIADVDRRATRTRSAAREAQDEQARLRQEEDAQMLGLLQAQIEPHFLINSLGNVRRLYRTRPDEGAETIGSLMRVLQAALPHLRRSQASLADELDLVQAYLHLFQVRQGGRISFDIEADAELLRAEFPPMLLATLVENAVKHGLEPAGGGRIWVRAAARQEMLQVSVIDNGIGFGAASGAGTGVGLVNVRRQLKARYGAAGRLALQAREPSGAAAVVSIPLRVATAE